MKKVKPNKLPKPKRPNLKTLDSKLDAVYSKYIRLRDSKDGLYCECISCGKVKPIKEMQNGHFKKRGAGLGNAAKYDERNTHAQCVHCNMYLNGNESSQSVAIEALYGFGVLQELEILSKQLLKKPAIWYEEKIKYYTAKYKELDKYNLWG